MLPSLVVVAWCGIVLFGIYIPYFFEDKIVTTVAVNAERYGVHSCMLSEIFGTSRIGSRLYC
jgi:hypothetical protein